MSESTNFQPLVSICIPSYNGADFIEKAILSSQNQTYTTIEIIITDDCSTDTTLAIANKLAAADKRIKVFSNATNKGLINNWMSCVQHSSGEWIKFLFQDDLLEPTCVQQMMEVSILNNAKVYSSARRFSISKRHILI